MSSAIRALPSKRQLPTAQRHVVARTAQDMLSQIRSGALAPGALPADWLYGEGVRAALRSAARQRNLHMEGYGKPFGLPELRAHLSTLLEARRLSAREDQIVLTQGASQALDLVVRECLKPGDAVLVEDAGYPPLFELLKNHGVQVLSIARTEGGPDVLLAPGELFRPDGSATVCAVTCSMILMYRSISSCRMVCCESAQPAFAMRW